MRFEWDEAKRAADIAKHGVDLTAIVDFEWETALVRSDTREGLWRVARSGSWLVGARLHAVVFAEREDDVVRVISLRRATKKAMMSDAENS